MKKTLLLTAGIMLAGSGLHAQQLRDGYVVPGANTSSEQFHTLLNNWTPEERSATTTTSTSRA